MVDVQTDRKKFAVHLLPFAGLTSYLVLLREVRQPQRVDEESSDLERAKIRRVSAKLWTWASQDAPGIGHVSSKFKPCWRRGRHDNPGLGVR